MLSSSQFLCNNVVAISAQTFAENLYHLFIWRVDVTVLDGSTAMSGGELWKFLRNAGESPARDGAVPQTVEGKSLTLAFFLAASKAFRITERFACIQNPAVSTEDEEKDWIVESFYMLPKELNIPNAIVESPRRIRLRQLIRKVNRMSRGIGLKLEQRGHVRIGKDGETYVPATKFEIGAASFTIVQDRIDSSSDARTRLYWILCNALRSGEIGRVKLSFEQRVLEFLCVETWDKEALLESLSKLRK